ncbi:hypothetical protein Q8A73_021659 [Channa argus]|nr:hypothetical protein Q8A73_021659 [Channa argus]
MPQPPTSSNLNSPVNHLSTPIPDPWLSINVAEVPVLVSVSDSRSTSTNTDAVPLPVSDNKPVPESAPEFADAPPDASSLTPVAGSKDSPSASETCPLLNSTPKKTANPASKAACH